MKTARLGIENLGSIRQATLPFGDLTVLVGAQATGVRVHYFDRLTGATRDISELDLEAEAGGKSGWGGLSEFSGRANDAVARAVANSGR
ncbi:MAG: hypothetical protein HS113_09530 [Verrucomicrobiales bacterium]|nr:hypothetical protein [Verrucomicrobiales bacterium]